MLSVVMSGFLDEERLRELLTTMGDRFTDEEVSKCPQEITTEKVPVEEDFQVGNQGYFWPFICIKDRFTLWNN